MAFDAFLVFTTGSGQLPLEGETQDKQFSAQKAIAIDSFSFGIHNTVNIGSATGGAGAGKAQFSQFKITKAVDRTSPNLLLYAGRGAHIQQVDLYLRKAGGGKASGAVFLQYSFKLVAVADVQWSGASGDDTVKEEVTFEYGALQVKYTSQAPNGGTGSTYTGGWNRIKNGPGFTIPGIG